VSLQKNRALSVTLAALSISGIAYPLEKAIRTRGRPFRFLIDLQAKGRMKIAIDLRASRITAPDSSRVVEQPRSDWLGAPAPFDRAPRSGILRNPGGVAAHLPLPGPIP
jgi:hypothetical protein